MTFRNFRCFFGLFVERRAKIHVEELEIYGLSKFQLRTTLGGRKIVEKPKRKIENFERPFTPRTWLRSVRNFGKTRFRRFRTIPDVSFLTPKKKSTEKNRPKIFAGKIFRRQKIENCKSFETRFAEVWRRLELCLGSGAMAAVSKRRRPYVY